VVSLLKVRRDRDRELDEVADEQPATSPPPRN